MTNEQLFFLAEASALIPLGELFARKVQSLAFPTRQKIERLFLNFTQSAHDRAIAQLLISNCTLL